MMVRAGVGLADITPPAGLAMTGFGARTLPAEGAHDRLTARALVIGETAIVVADVLGIDADMSERIRARSGLPPEAVVVAAVHNHGGPVSMPERLGAKADADYLRMLEDGCVKAISRARQTAVEAELYFGYGEDPALPRNRRRADGPVDRALPVLAVRDRAGETIAVLVSYACHPVVLDATNLLWTADYPHFVRAGIEAAFRRNGIFLTGCAGDINTGHSAHASLGLEQNAAQFRCCQCNRQGYRELRAGGVLATDCRKWHRYGERSRPCISSAVRPNNSKIWHSLGRGGETARQSGRRCSRSGRVGRGGSRLTA